MPVTSFYKVGSRMVGEQTDGGTRINYVTDALGSIVQAIDENHNTTYTARYKPFGDVLSSTGTAPAFTWVGSFGYLQAAGRPHSEFYVRARFYSKKEGRWTTVDPLWPGESAYGYVSGRIQLWIDASGMASGSGSKNCCKDRSIAGGCIALLCSLKSAKDAIDDLTGIKDIDSTELKPILEKIKNLWGKDYSPDDCCKSAHGSPSFGSLAWGIQKICSLLENHKTVCWAICGSTNKAECIYRCNYLTGTAVISCKERCRDSVEWEGGVVETNICSCIPVPACDEVSEQ
jgi:RHS repeat-associated protein